MTTTKVNLANTVEGILPVANGGTGTSTGVAPGGSTTQVQYNNAGAFGGSANLTFNGTTLTANDITDSSLTAGRVVYAGTAGNLVDSANLVWDNTNARLGIGTSSPGDRIHAAASVAAGLSLQATGTGGSTWRFLSTDNAASIGGGYLGFNNGSYRMVIDSSGNLLVGATSLLGQASKSLIVNNSASNVGLIVQSSASGDVGIDGIRIGKFDNNSTTSQIFVRFTINNQAIGSGSITANGANACTFGSFSDERLKENIVSLPSQLENICSLRPVEFDYKTGGHQIGFIAQEMQEVYPDAVAAGDDEMLMIGGWSKTEARLVKAIQELNAKVEAQAVRIAELEGAK